MKAETHHNLPSTAKGHTHNTHTNPPQKFEWHEISPLNADPKRRRFDTPLLKGPKVPGNTIRGIKNAEVPKRYINWKLDLCLLVVSIVIFCLIILLKSRTAAIFSSSPVLISYTFFVTLFQVSRMVSALMYKHSYSLVTNGTRSEGRERAYLPYISFVIPCMNEERGIKNTIDMCYAAEYPKLLMEVIVINDGSTDGTLEKIMEAKEEHPDLVVIDWKENKGKRHGMAEGFNRAEGEIVIQLDSDSYIEPSFVRKFIEPFRNPEVGAISAHTDPTNKDQNWITKMETAYYFMSFRILKAAESTFHTVFCCSGCASAYRRSVVMPILDIWLNEMFLGKPITWGDDRALTNWVIRLGYRTLYASDVQAYTEVPSTLRQFIKQQIRWKKGWFVNSLFASKFIVKRNPFVAFTYFFPLTIVTLLTPFMAIRAFLYTPFTSGYEATIYYVLGVLLIASFILMFYRFFAPENKYWPYIFVWAAINMFVLSYLLLYALATIQNRSWGTRGAVGAQAPAST